MTVTYRSAKGSHLTIVEVDGNFSTLEAATYEARNSALSAYNRANHIGVDNPNLVEQFGNYTLSLSDASPQTVIRMNVATDNTITVPTYATVAIPVGTRIPIDQWGDGQTSIVAATGVTIRSAASLQVKAKYSRVWLEKQSTDEWLLTGDIALGGPVGSPPVCTVPPSISGTAVSGSTLTRVAGTWTGTPSPTVTGQWYANAVAIGGQTASTYITANPGDDGKAITYRESAVSTAGGPTQATSNSITMTPAAATKPVSTGVLPAITGSAVVGATLTCSSGGWTNSPTSHKYIWKDGATTLEDTGYLTPGTSDTYVVLVGQTGRTITCQVTAQNASGVADVPVTSTDTPIAAGPTSSSRTIPAAGTTMSVVFSSAVNSGAGGFNTGLVVSASGGATTATYASGTGTTTLVYNLSRTIQQGETVSLTYTQPVALDGIKSSVTGAYVASFVGLSVTNSSTQSAAITWEGPLTISTGGTHNITNRNIRSQSASTPAISITTDCTVNITNCRIESMWQGIRTFNNVNLTVRNTTYKAVNPNVSGQSRGLFLDTGASSASNIIIENCSLNYGGGVKLNTGTFTSLMFRYNKVNNISGLHSNGAGGYYTQTTYDDRNTFTQMVQLNKVTINSGCEIAWNQVINTPNDSLCADQVNISGSQGTASFPINVHDNYFGGCWGMPAATIAVNASPVQLELTGAFGCRYVNVDNNQMVACHGVAMANWEGIRDVSYTGNRAISSGKLDGSNIAVTGNELAMYVYASDALSAAPIVFNNNSYSYIANGVAKHFSYSAGEPGIKVTSTNWTQLAAATEASEAAELTTWNTKVSDAITAETIPGSLGSTIPLW